MRKHIFNVLGFAFLALAVIGLFLPIMPTVPFLIVAAACFSQGSERIYLWMMNHPHFGPALKDWSKNRAIRPRTKILSCTMILISLSYAVFFRSYSVMFKIILSGVMLSVIAFILTRNSGGSNEN